MKKVTQEQQVIEVLRNRRGYEDSVKAYRDINNAINTAKKEAKAEGLVEGEAIGAQKTARENARKMKSKGFSVEDIAEVTGLSIEEINML